MADSLDGEASALGATIDRLQIGTDALTVSTNSFAAAMTRAFTQATAGGLALDDVLKGLALRISSLAVSQAFRPITTGIFGGLNDLFSGSFGSGFNAAASARSSIGKLPGVLPAAAGSTVNVQVSTPDLASFRRSEAYLTGQIARAVARGQRGL